jgi:methyl-accepting chemotaxis protein
MSVVATLRRVRIGTRLASGFGIILVVLGSALVAGNYVQQQNAVGQVDALQAANDKVLLASAMKAATLEAAVAMRNIGLQSDVAGTQREEARVKEQKRKYLEARDRLVARGLNAAEKRIVENVAELDRKMESPLEQVVAQGLMFNQEMAVRILATTIDPLSQSLFAEINQLVQVQQQSVEATLASAAKAAERLKAMLYVLGIAALAFAAACAWVLTRSIVAPLRDAVGIARDVAAGRLARHGQVSGRDEVSQLLQALDEMTRGLTAIVGDVRTGTEAVDTASQEIAKANMDLSSRTETQASFLEETAGSLEELTATVGRNADHARQANELAVSASSIAAKGGTVVGKAVDTMASIKGSSSRIENIIGVIDGIAFQTNILALNAAVEAARAGAEGRGFAVVAAEVRDLAQRSATAARETKQLIGASVREIDAGSTLIVEAGETMRQIVSSVDDVARIVGQIAKASAEQRLGIEQVNSALGQMDSMTQQNAAMVEQAAAVAANLRDQAGYLAKSISAFVVEHDAQAGSGLQPAPQPERAGSSLERPRHPVAALLPRAAQRTRR